MKEEEKWAPIPEYEGLYEVSTFGRVRSLYSKTRIKDKEHRLLLQKLDDKGYYRVNLHNDKGQKAYLVSRAVALAFIPNPLGLPFVGHNNDDKKNNSVANLYWTDSKENNHHNGKYDRFLAAHNERIKSIAEKLSSPVVATSIKTGEQQHYSSMQEAQRRGYSTAHISQCCAGKRKSHKGYTWKKLEKESLNNV